MVRNTGSKGTHYRIAIIDPLIGRVYLVVQEDLAMDMNQKDHAALRVNTCPDCGGPVDIAATGPWCRACDVWFEFVSGWVMRNKAAAQFFALLNAARRDAVKADLDTEKASRKKEATPAKTVDPRARPQAGDITAQHAVISGRGYPHRRDLPVSLYRWLLK